MPGFANSVAEPQYPVDYLGKFRIGNKSSDAALALKYSFIHKIVQGLAHSKAIDSINFTQLALRRELIAAMQNFVLD
jgi:hypothetical protein